MHPMAAENTAEGRLERQIRFILEIDRLKTVVRQTLLTDRSRQETDAEHSWHLALIAVLLSEYAAEGGIDVARVVKMALVHDIVEIDAGDTYCYDDKGAIDKPARERAAADRLFALLPEDQCREMRALWEEFEARKTAEAKYAAALDRLQPLLQNYATGGAMWRKHGVGAEKVLERNRHIGEGAPELWKYAENLIRSAVEKGYLQK